MRTAMALMATLLVGSTIGLGPITPEFVRSARLSNELATKPGEPETQPTSGPATGPASQPTTTQAAESRPTTEPASQPVAEEPTYFAIVGGIVHTIDGPDRRGVTILCKDGRILEIGARVEIPESAERLDATGFHVYPGLVACEARGIVGADPAEDTTNVFGTILRLANAGGITTVFSRSAAAKAAYGSVEDIPLRSDLFELIRYGSADQRRELRSSLRRAREHLRAVETYEKAKAAGDDDAKKPDEPKGLEQAIKLLKHESTAYVSADSKRDLIALAELAEEFGIAIVVRGALEGWTVADKLGRAGIRVIVTPRRQRGADPELNAPSGNNIENAALLYRGGVDIAITTASAGISLVGLAGNDMQHLPMEAAFAVRGGLPEAAAIEAITLGAARVLGIDDRVGSIAPGKDADFIVTDGPLLDFYTQVHWTVINGRIVYDKAEESLFGHIRPRTPTTQPAPYKFWPRPFNPRPAAASQPAS